MPPRAIPYVPSRAIPVKRLHLIASIALFCSAAACSAVAAGAEGFWLGYERMEGMPAEKKGDRWYYQNRLSIMDGVIRLEKLPVIRNGKHLSYSASDGAFPVFRGRLVEGKDATVANLEIESCDYCRMAGDVHAPEGQKAWQVFHHGIERQGEPKDYPIRFLSGDSITLDKITFHRVQRIEPTRNIRKELR